MDHHEMTAVLERHHTAGDDVEGAMAVYTDDVVHDAVGFPGSPRSGKDAARDFDRFLIANFRREDGEPLNRFFDGDTMILEENVTGTVIGEILLRPLMQSSTIYAWNGARRDTRGTATSPWPIKWWARDPST